MSTPLEVALENQAVAEAAAAGWESFKVAMIGQRGFPDRIFTRGDWTFYVEFKRKGRELDAPQVKVKKRFDAVGTKFNVIDNIEDFRKLLALETPS